MTLGIFVSILILVIGVASQIIPRLEKYYKHRPKLVVELEQDNGITATQTSIGASKKNDGRMLYAGDPNMWWIYRFDWNFNLVIRNNSEHTAYSIRLLQHKSRPQIKFRINVNMNKPLKVGEEIILPFTIHQISECQIKDREEKYSKPEFFSDLMIVFDYKNSDGKNFQSRYYFNSNNTIFKQIPLIELRNYWR